ncbi:MAG: hypothetical protein GY856_28080 [bacterium]|nr:hypothetical protein [bacterium]
MTAPELDFDVTEFLENLTLDRLLEVLSANERELLRASTLFELPVPLGVLSDFARELGVAKATEEVGERLFALALWEAHVAPEEETAVVVNALVRPRAGELGAGERARLAGLVAAPLFAAWGGAEGRRSAPPQGKCHEQGAPDHSCSTSFPKSTVHSTTQHWMP